MNRRGEFLWLMAFGLGVPASARMLRAGRGVLGPRSRRSVALSRTNCSRARGSSSISRSSSGVACPGGPRQQDSAATRAVLPPRAYFMTHHDWCDHLLFSDDGTFTNGFFAGRGTWRLSWHGDGDRVARIALELEWDRRPGDRGAEGDAGGEASAASQQEVLWSLDGGTKSFTAAGAALESMEGQELPPLPPLPPSPLHPPGRSRPRGLVFSSVGSQCLRVVRDHWLRAPSAAEFDVALVFYKDPTSDVYRELEELERSIPSVELHLNAGMKWPNFRHWIEKRGGVAALAGEYDYVWVVDDDVRLPTSEINQLFDVLREHPEIKFACPSFDAGSDGVWRYFDGHDARYKLRYTDFVECTAPVLKTTMLLDAGFDRCLRAVRTGCFIDFCFFPAAGSREDGVAIIDAVQCHHPPRGPEVPSEMRQVKPWEDHKEDDIFFEAEGVPKEWWWWRKPRIFGGIPANLNMEAANIGSALGNRLRARP